MLKQLFTSVLMNCVDIFLAVSPIGKYLPLFTSISVNNYSIFDGNVTASGHWELTCEHRPIRNKNEV